MNKQDLIAKIAKEVELSKSNAAAAVDSTSRVTQYAPKPAARGANKPLGEITLYKLDEKGTAREQISEKMFTRDARHARTRSTCRATRR